MKNSKDNKEKRFQEIWNSPFPDVPEREIQESWEVFSKGFKPGTKRRIQRNLIRIGSIAAVLLVLFSAYYYREIYNPSITVHNISSVEKEVVLPDGSLVFLKKGASIQYKEYFRNSRAVKLKGSAFFDVIKDSLRVFKVFIGPTTIRVLGTSFYVKAKEESKNVEVSLFTGDVRVSIGNKAASWNIDPGEKFVYHGGETHIEKFNVDLTFERGNEFIDVDHIALEKVHKFLSERFGYTFIAKKGIKFKRVTLRIDKADSLEQILKIISIISDKTYEINRKTKQVRVFSK